MPQPKGCFLLDVNGCYILTVNGCRIKLAESLGPTRPAGVRDDWIEREDEEIMVIIAGFLEMEV